MPVNGVTLPPGHDTSTATDLRSLRKRAKELKDIVESASGTHANVSDFIDLLEDLGNRCYALGAKWIASKFYRQAAEVAAAKAKPGLNWMTNDPEVLAYLTDKYEKLEKKSNDIKVSMRYKGVEEINIINWPIDPKDIVNDFTLKCLQRGMDLSELCLKFIAKEDKDYDTPEGLFVIKTNKANDMSREFDKVRRMHAIIGDHAVRPLFFLFRHEYGKYDESSLAYAMKRVRCLDPEDLYDVMKENVRRTFGAFDEIVHVVDTLDEAGEPLGDLWIRLEKPTRTLKINNFLISLINGGENFYVMCNDPWAWNYELKGQPKYTPQDSLEKDKKIVDIFIDKLFDLFAP